jgi:hypothetical protein
MLVKSTLLQLFLEEISPPFPLNFSLFEVINKVACSHYRFFIFCFLDLVTGSGFLILDPINWRLLLCRGQNLIFCVLLKLGPGYSVCPSTAASRRKTSYDSVNPGISFTTTWKLITKYTFKSLPLPMAELPQG